MGAFDERSLQQFREDGFVIFPGVLNQDQLVTLDQWVTQLSRYQGPALVQTVAGEILSILGIHLINPAFCKIVTEPALLHFVERIIGSQVYIYQSSLQLKPLSSPPLRWHQDFNAFNRFDGLPEPKGLSLGFFLDEVTELNAPVHGIRSSQRAGQLPARLTPPNDWYEIPQSIIEEMVESHEVVSLAGAAGSLLLMDLNFVHASGNPLLARRRAIAYFNLVSVSVKAANSTRPNFIASREVVPLDHRPAIVSLR